MTSYESVFFLITITLVEVYCIDDPSFDSSPRGNKTLNEGNVPETLTSDDRINILCLIKSIKAISHTHLHFRFGAILMSL